MCTYDNILLVVYHNLSAGWS